MGFKRQKGIVEAARRNRRGLTESVVNDRKFVIENQHGQFWNGKMFGPLQAADRFDGLDDLPEELVDGETNLELYTFGSGTEPDDYKYFADAGDEDPTASVTAKDFPRFAESVDSQSQTVTGDSKLDEYLSKFPDNAQNWGEATDEIREITRAARLAHGDIDLNLSGDDEYESHPDVAPMNYRSFKTPSEWNRKSKEYIARVWKLMSQEAKEAFLKDVSRLYYPDSGYEESAGDGRPWFKVPLVNDGSIGTRCGYGEGRTKEEAVEDALSKARERDPNAYYEGGEVHFRADVYL
jgi:hypothetical protein